FMRIRFQAIRIGCGISSAAYGTDSVMCAVRTLQVFRFRKAGACSGLHWGTGILLVTPLG
ncbi:MAG: hypothetical protein LDL33_05745, partial [Desulfomonile sp.]|nr:hypothetical protein [Desulfomonile sp.]